MYAIIKYQNLMCWIIQIWANPKGGGGGGLGGGGQGRYGPLENLKLLYVLLRNTGASN